MTGTSQATAFVTGAAVLVMAKKEKSNPEDVKKYILSTGDANSSLIAKTKSYRQLNLYKALTILDSNITLSGVASSNEVRATTNGLINDPASLQGSTENGRQVANFGKSLVQKLEQQQQKN